MHAGLSQTLSTDVATELDRRQDGFLIRMLAGLFLRVDERVTIHDFVNATTGWDQGHLADLVGLVIE